MCVCMCVCVCVVCVCVRVCEYGLKALFSTKTKLSLSQMVFECDDPAKVVYRIKSQGVLLFSTYNYIIRR